MTRLKSGEWRTTASQLLFLMAWRCRPGFSLTTWTRKCSRCTCFSEERASRRSSLRSVPAGVTCGQLLIFSSSRVSLLLATSTFRDGSSTGVSSISSEDSDLELTNTTRNGVLVHA
ncbi:hypothetical protein EYF80_025286 [Liparis tanakae]|uniref:Uncharacterized protein n=1 Tax=Liparis tanakae TaxID=230148 RepID=A0A4Z2HF89_9TELE|nr:hypothetical protein EYF80_025286 [Liparis tanakae]